MRVLRKESNLKLRFSQKTFFVVIFLLVLIVPLLFLYKGTNKAQAASADNTIHHYLYVFPDKTVYVYDMDNNFQLIKQISLPMTNGGRGIMVDPAGGYLYLSYNGDGGIHGNGSLLKYDLVNDKLLWTQNYPFGIDSGALTPDGKTIYMPDGEAAYDGTWHILNASDGSVKGSIFTVTGNAAHNTIVGFTGQKVYMGGLNNPNFFVASTSTNKITEQIGPLKGGVRPFTINGSESLVFTTHTGFLGFQVSNLNTGKILYTVPVKGFTAPAGSTSSHGITISPDEKELYLIDTPNSYVHVFDISKLPNTAPTQVANIQLQPAMGGTESPCLYDCTKEGWLLHVADGRYVVVGDSGDIIDTTTRKIAYNLPTVNNTRKFLEIDWQNGHPIFTTTRQGMGYVGIPAGTPTPTPLNPPNATPTPSTTVSPSPSPSPSPGIVLAQDTFQRANQKFWGTASDGNTWGGFANTNAAFSIQNNTGQVANTSGAYDAVLGSTATDAEVLFTGSSSSFTKNDIGALLRWTNKSNWYRAYINGAQLVVQKKVNGTVTTLSTASFAASANTNYSIRFRVVGTTLYAKAWPTSGTEPTSWTITTTDSSLSSGQCGIRINITSGVTVNITSFQATNPD